ncbi:helix-turn-helix transcriptional regulator, partial [Corallococcus carmarthensis]|uniref:helix-turn-helix transcriptional regulator n=2 Tax=Myxococcaceae TaxID=31 RepID=UPI001C10B781
NCICHIKTIATRLDVTQLEIAEALGVSRNTITDLSRNKSLPNLALAYKIVDFFNARAKEKGMDIRWTVEDIWERTTEHEKAPD